MHRNVFFIILLGKDLIVVSCLEKDGFLLMHACQISKMVIKLFEYFTFTFTSRFVETACRGSPLVVNELHALGCYENVVRCPWERCFKVLPDLFEEQPDLLHKPIMRI
ncbi:hypothetical protein MKW98_009549 [Papaver atlanticum]|uniref:Uncharacterized protein n=1 Tax=Papaver atlanticum TaxID=357466 RepID=A0AAD4SHV4_9MAGN|nr:hypothetical protein MKW98_009549 [Papaver atlanticum]